MPICRKCEKPFPFRIVIDGKTRTLSKRKFCLECSPFDKHNTRRLDYLNSDVKPNKIYKTWEEKECPACHRKHNWKGRMCPTCQTNYRRYLIKQKMVDYKGGKCQRCGYDRNIKALEFHHINPENKLFGISGNSSHKWSVLKKELDKCILLCSNCHVELADEKLLENSPIRQFWERKRNDM